jgi:hypothetical protein
VITAFIGAIAVRTVFALYRGQLVPAPVVSTTPGIHPPGRCSP